jgi:hypothetical protein
LRKRKRPAPSEPKPSNPSNGRGDAVCGSFFAFVEDWEEVVEVVAFWSEVEVLL